MELTLLHVRGKSIGYARYGTYLHQELSKMGVDVYDKLEAPTDPNENERLIEQAEGFESDLGPRRHKQTNIVAWVSVPTHARGWWKGQTPIISSMWEADTLPESFRENLHEFDTVIVPSAQNVELFSRYHDNVKLVPLGVDPADWHYVERKAPTTTFDFLIGGSGERKGVDLAVKAFRKLWGEEGSWGDGPIPTLTMKSPKPSDLYGARVYRVQGKLSAADEISLYEQAHCYLQPSRGEGFGLQPLQAMAQGIPTILTDAHGHAGFAHLGYGVKAAKSKASYFIYGDAGDWWEPDLDELCERMQFVYYNYAEACAKAKVSAEIIARDWTWRNCAESFVDAIGRERLELPYEGTNEWVVPESRLYRVRLLTAWQADVAGTQYQFEKGVDYWEPADIKRIMFEAQVLDPECTENAFTRDGVFIDNGLSEEQVVKSGAYRARHSFCDTCGQKLNSGTTKADELFAEMEKMPEGAVT